MCPVCKVPNKEQLSEETSAGPMSEADLELSRQLAFKGEDKRAKTVSESSDSMMTT